MAEKSVPFTTDQLERIIAQYPTPFHLYDEGAIRRNARRFLEAFSWVPGGFANFFAVKALPNPYILEILKEEGMGADCSSLPELLLADAAGIRGEEIMFTSNDTPALEFKKAVELGAVVNLDDLTHISFLDKHAGLPELLSLRYNPGPLKKGNAIIGNPQESKYGFTREQIVEGYRILKERGVRRLGLHTMVASNELNPDYFVETASLLFDLAVEIAERLGIRLEFVNLGGGIERLYREKIVAHHLDPLRVVMECGRVVTGPYGYLVARVLHRKETYKRFIGLDASMANLMRPGMYGAYHHITVMGKEGVPAEELCDVTGSLCENNDRFAIDRRLPEISPGDVIVIHDTGAHGHAMGFNYNGKLRSAELLLREDGSVKLIRRAETPADYFATLDYPRLRENALATSNRSQE